MIELNNISKKFDKTLFENFSIAFEEGKTTALIAPSGAGKTTLINILLGFLKADKGSISSVENKKFSAVFQEDRLLKDFTVLENVRVSGADENKCESFLEMFELDTSNNKYPDELSGGMKRRTAVVRCLLKEADIYILDEAFKGIDQALKNSIIQKSKEILKGKTCIFITHDIDEAKEMADYIKILSNPPAEIKYDLKSEEIDKVFISKFKMGQI